MTTKDCIFAVCLGIMLALIICAFGIATDLYGKNSRQQQLDCIEKGGSYVAVYLNKGTEDEYTDGYQCLMQEEAK